MRIALLSLVLLAGCYSAPEQVDPVTQKTYRSSLGNDYRSQLEYVRKNYLTQSYIAQDNGELPEPEMLEACNEIFERIIAVVPPEHRRGFQYKLYLTAGTSVNAFTYGAGRVQLHFGLLARCEDAAELAGTLAHEIGHNSHDHIGQQIGRTERFGSIMNFGGILGRPGRALTGIVIGPWAGLALVSYSRTQEREADDRAVDYNVAAGIDPDGLARFFGRMEKSNGLELFKTHPDPGNRVEEIRKRIRTAYAGGPRDPLVTTPAFERARARAGEILPYYEALQRALAADEPRDVHAACDIGIKDLPNHAQFHFWKGVALAAEEKIKEGLPYLRTASKLDRTNIMIPYTHCILELQGGDAKICEAAATRAIELMDVLPQPYYARGAARLVLERKQEAHADFDAALARVPDRDRRRVAEKLKEIDPDYVPTMPG